MVLHHPHAGWRAEEEVCVGVEDEADEGKPACALLELPDAERSNDPWPRPEGVQGQSGRLWCARARACAALCVRASASRMVKRLQSSYDAGMEPGSAEARRRIRAPPSEAPPSVVEVTELRGCKPVLSLQPLRLRCFHYTHARRRRPEARGASSRFGLCQAWMGQSVPSLPGPTVDCCG